jgi:hypothetical protein
VTKISTRAPAEKETADSFPRITPIAAIRANCLECGGGSFKAVLWCSCDGVHSTRCPFWPFRFGTRPETVAERLGPALVTPGSMPGSEVSEDDLPGGMEAAAVFLAGRRAETANRSGSGEGE